MRRDEGIHTGRHGGFELHASIAGSVGGEPLDVFRADIEQQRRPYDAMHLWPEGRRPVAEDR